MDADSCPVKDEIVEIAKAFSIKVVFVASYAHMKNEVQEAEWRFVDCDQEAADLYIMNHTSSRDIVITQDIGLASTLLLKNMYVLSPRGTLYEESNIRTMLDMRYLSAKARKKGIYGKGPKPFTKQDRIHFINTLTKILSKVEGIP
ncbi:YaiI/YqxD family protein [Bacillus mesophilum]|uniref:UPF0178 protein F7732_07390 n=1 Tax=Bacillus mesophilum TaxID=1071718 RepID=A0A7V7RNC4_9BACI|nr:YaiI/YqxD family protein [Bacillus mesophilum]KAB2333898.1 YaiI/YqxD family protein [Bacillus mesophilum]